MGPGSHCRLPIDVSLEEFWSSVYAEWPTANSVFIVHIVVRPSGRNVRLTDAQSTSGGNGPAYLEVIFTRVPRRSVFSEVRIAPALLLLLLYVRILISLTGYSHEARSCWCAVGVLWDFQSSR
jgi:hypothetical protein